METERALYPGASAYVRAINDFIFVSHEPVQSDLIFVPGASHAEHALKAAELYRAGYAPLVLPAGRFSVKLGHFKGVSGAERADYPDEYETEWHFLRAVLMRAGVPERAILREDQSTFTWENALFSRRVTDAAGIRVERALLCCRAFHARRALTYYQTAFPEADIRVCPAVTPGLGPEDWYLTEAGRRRVLGEVSRMGGQVAEAAGMLLDGIHPHEA